MASAVRAALKKPALARLIDRPIDIDQGVVALFANTLAHP